MFRAVNFSWNKKIIGLVLLWFIFSSTAGAEARPYPGSESGGSQGQGANATTSFGLVSGARYARLLQSTSHADATSHGGPDASVTIAPPQAPAHIINDDKKESTNPMDDGKIVHCINSCCRLHYRGKCTKCCPPGED